MVRVAVYGSSSPATPQKYLDAAAETGRLLAAGDHICINGAGSQGVMGALNRACQEHGATIYGVIHEMFVVDGQEHEGIAHLDVAHGPTLAVRKQLLSDQADCFISLPGGPGTWDELWEVVCERQLGLNPRPIAVVNTDGYYDGFKLQIERAQADGILHRDADGFLRFFDTPKEALDYCLGALEAPEEKVLVQARGQPWSFCAGAAVGAVLGAAVVGVVMSRRA